MQFNDGRYIEYAPQMDQLKGNARRTSDLNAQMRLTDGIAYVYVHIIRCP